METICQVNADPIILVYNLRLGQSFWKKLLILYVSDFFLKSAEKAHWVVSIGNQNDPHYEIDFSKSLFDNIENYVEEHCLGPKEGIEIWGGKHK